MYNIGEGHVTNTGHSADYSGKTQPVSYAKEGQVKFSARLETKSRTHTDTNYNRVNQHTGYQLSVI